jgi:hypothetical protein
MTRSFVWIRSAPWDIFWILSPYWGTLAFFLLTYLAGKTNAMFTMLFVIPIASILHISLPSVFYFHSANGKKLLNSRGKKEILSVGILVAVVSAISWLGINVNMKAALLALCGLYLTWTFWHFSAQNFGVLALYRYQSGQGRNLDVQVDKIYAIITTLVFSPLIWLSQGSRFHGLYLLGFDKNWVVDGVALIPAASVVCALAYTIFELKKPSRNIPKLLFAISLCVQNLALYKALSIHWVLGYFFQLFVHHTVEIGIQGRLLTSSLKQNRQNWLGWLGLILAGLSWISMYAYGMFFYRDDYVRLSASGILEAERWAKLATDPGLVFFMGTFFIISLVHFYVDSRIYSFRRAINRELVLMPIIKKDS